MEKYVLFKQQANESQRCYMNHIKKTSIQGVLPKIMKHFITIKGKLYQEDIKIINKYTSDYRALKCMKQYLKEL